MAIDTPGRNRPTRPYRVGNAYGARVLQITRVGATGEILLHLLSGRSFTARDTELVTVVELADSRANDYSFHTPGLIIGLRRRRNAGRSSCPLQPRKLRGPRSDHR